MSGSRGFSLAELIVVVGVLGILTAVGMPSFLSYLRNATIKDGAQELVALLNQGRLFAVKENQSVCVEADVANPGYGTRLRYTLRNGASCAGATVTCAANGYTPPCILTFAGSDSNGYVTLSNRVQWQPPAADIYFTYLGAAGTGATMAMRAIDTPSNTATVTLAVSGRVHYWFP
jgi:prepilin-type N-terminal cleavage/methylation domain-containing protein